MALDQYLQFISEVGFPIAAAAGAGVFVFLAVKFILRGVVSSITSLANRINEIGSTVKSMNDEIVRIDILVSEQMGLKQDVDRVGRTTNHVAGACKDE